MSQVFECSEDDKSVILGFYGRTPSSFQQDVDDVKCWLKQQPQLPEIPSDHAIQVFLLMNKLSIEKTKKKIDMYYTIRGLLPDLYTVPPDDPRIGNISRTMTYLPLPKLTAEKYRITLCKLVDPDPEKFDMMAYIWFVLHVMELRLEEDFAVSEITIYDIRDLKLGHLAKITPLVIKKLHTVSEKVFSSRYQSLHFIHSGSLVDNLVTMVKMVLPEKLARRINVHKDVESLKEHVPIELLPKDYGGQLGSLEELNGNILCKLDFYKDRIKELMKMRTNERLRVGQPINDDMLGFHGNFRKLDVD